jgi:hypothetical protein
MAKGGDANDDDDTESETKMESVSTISGSACLYEEQESFLYPFASRCSSVCDEERRLASIEYTTKMPNASLTKARDLFRLTQILKLALLGDFIAVQVTAVP